MYSDLGTVIFMGDYNAKANLISQNNRDTYLSTFLSDINFIAIDTLPLCTGARNSFVSYDGQHETLIDHICIPVEKLDCVTSCTILDGDCLNVSRHRPVICKVQLPIVGNTSSSDSHDTI